MRLELISAAILTGAQYAVAALGFAVYLYVLRVANLAYGGVFIASGFAFALTLRATNRPILSIVVGLLASVVLGFVVQTIAVKPLGNISDTNSQRHIGVIVTTLAVEMILENIASLIWGYGVRVPEFSIYQLGVSDGFRALEYFVICIIFAVLVQALFMRTNSGTRIRAVSGNPRLAAICGLQVSQLRWGFVAITAAIGGIAGILVLSQVGQVSASSARFYGLKAIVVAILAGRLSIKGLFGAGILLAMCEAFATVYFGAIFRDAVGFCALLFVLGFRTYFGPGMDLSARS